MFDGANMTIPVSQMDRAVAFYTGVLEFVLKRRIGTRFAMLEHPGLNLLLQERSDAQAVTTAPRAGAIGLWVKDIDEARRMIEARGAIMEGETVDLPEWKIAFLSDPDGTPIYIAQLALKR